MLVAHDKAGNRIYANNDERYKECFCPECGKPLTHKKGEMRVSHFAHKVDENCPYALDKDSKSEWHIHMQELFPSESLERRFKDDYTGEVHIADVYLKQSNTVIEFQHSPISVEEFKSRTLFHVNNGRRIVWVFEERGKDPDSEYGRLRKEDGEWYRWLRSPRRMLASIGNVSVLQASNYSVCVYYGEEDIVHRLINEAFDYSEVVLSVHPIKLYENMDSDDFFKPETYWKTRMIEGTNKPLNKQNRGVINPGFVNGRPMRRSFRL